MQIMGQSYQKTSQARTAKFWIALLWLTLTAGTTELFAAPAYQAGSAASINGSAWATSWSGSYTVSAGTDRVLVVFAITTHGGTPSGATFNSTAMTAGSTVSLGNSTTMTAYYLVNPTVTTANIVVNSTASGYAHIAAMVYTGVNQTTPMGNYGTGTNGGTDPLTVTVSHTRSSANSTVVVGSGSGHNHGGTAPTSNTTTLGTQRYLATTGGEIRSFAMSDYSPGSTGTSSYTHTRNAGSQWTASGAIALELMPAAAAGTNTSTITPSPTSTPSPNWTATRTATPCVGGAPTGAVLQYSGDDNITFYLNGVALTNCAPGPCFSPVQSYTLTAPQVAAINATGDNVLAVYTTDTGAVASGVSWLLTLTYGGGCSPTYIRSNGVCTSSLYAGNANTGVPPVTFPSGWTNNPFDDSAWLGLYVSTSGLNGAWVTIPDPAGGIVPWMWGVNSFSVITGGDGYLMRQHFALDGTACPITPPPSPTVYTSPTITRTFSRTPTPTNTSIVTQTSTSTRTTVQSPTNTPNWTATMTPTISPTFSASPTSSACQISSASIISNVAGTSGTSGNSGDGGAATSATLDNPTGVAVDSAGNVFIASHLNHRIRRVAAGTGIISNYGGNAGGSAGFSGDGGPATSGQMNEVSGVVVDPAGVVYVADRNNAVIRRISAGGTLSTFAGIPSSGGFSGDGGLATAAQINYTIEAIALDSTGANLYIADKANNRIRRVNVASGIITTVVGTGTGGFAGDGGLATAAQINQPEALYIDSAGNIYIADTGNCRIRKVTVATGIISTVAGNGTCSFGGDGGAATSASFSSPSGVIVDSFGNIFISTGFDNRIRMVNAGTGLISTIAGTGTGSSTGNGGTAGAATINFPAQLAFDSSGNLYLTDRYGHQVRKITACVPPTPTPTFTRSPVASATATPRMALTKTSNVGSATLGDTITFCINWSNDSSGTVTMSIWDTVATSLTYGGCSVGGWAGGSCSKPVGLVIWSLPTATAGSSGQVCFWGTVNGYPDFQWFLPPSIRFAGLNIQVPFSATDVDRLFPVDQVSLRARARI